MEKYGVRVQMGKLYRQYKSYSKIAELLHCDVRTVFNLRNGHTTNYAQKALIDALVKNTEITVDKG